VDERGSAYAWALFFIVAWFFSIIWYFVLDPLYRSGLSFAADNDLASVPYAEPFFTFFNSIYQWIPLLFLLFLFIATLKYASEKKEVEY